MTAPPPRRPWWRRKRFAVYAAVTLVAWYPLSLGPALCDHARGWLPFDAVYYPYEPLGWANRPSPTLRILFNDYGHWWYALGERHEAAASD